MMTISVLLLWMTGGLVLQVQDPPANQEKTAPADRTAVPSTRSDDSNIQGTWRVVFSEDNGRSAPPEALRDIFFVITKDKVIMESGGRKQESTYKLDPSTSPKSIDTTADGRTKTGIYDLQGDTLRICISEDTDLRPTAFDSQPDSVNDLVLTMKRMSPEPLNEKTGAKPKDNIPTDRDAIQGTWSVIHSVDSGRTAPPESLQGIRFVITKDKLIMESGGRKQESTYKLDPSTSPKSIDTTAEGRTKPCIYDLQGDTLKICMSQKTEIRPNAFDSQPDSVNDLVITMKRLAPEEISTEPKTRADSTDAKQGAESAPGSNTQKRQQ